MNADRFPVAVFGKPDGPEGRGRDFELLSVDAEFPQTLVALVERLARSVRWKSDGADEVYTPCFALWPLPLASGEPTAGDSCEEGEALLAMRMRDAGRDAAGRPHTLRVEAVFVACGRLSRSARLRLLLPSSWPERVGGDGGFILSAGDDSCLPLQWAALANSPLLQPIFAGHSQADCDPQFLRIASSAVSEASAEGSHPPSPAPWAETPVRRAASPADAPTSAAEASTPPSWEGPAPAGPHAVRRRFFEGAAPRLLTRPALWALAAVLLALAVVQLSARQDTNRRLRELEQERNAAAAERARGPSN